MPALIFKRALAISQSFIIFAFISLYILIYSNIITAGSLKPAIFIYTNSNTSNTLNINTTAGYRGLPLRGIDCDSAATQPFSFNNIIPLNLPLVKGEIVGFEYIAGYRGLPLRGIDCISDVSRFFDYTAGHRSLSLRGIDFTTRAQLLNTFAGYRGLPLRGIVCISDVSRFDDYNNILNIDNEILRPKGAQNDSVVKTARNDGIVRENNE